MFLLECANDYEKCDAIHMTLKSDKHNNYDVYNMVQCQILCTKVYIILELGGIKKMMVVR